MTPGAYSNPFVGLRPFESHESILFFGRQQQSLELLQRLHQYHFVGVVGSSGSGKSSLIKAGLIPRLKAGFLVKDRSRWVIATAKPGESPLYNLAKAIFNSLDNLPENFTAQDWEEKIRDEGADAILKFLEPLWQNNTNFFLLIDQFEELFRFTLNQNDFEKKDEAIDFVNILLQLADQKDLPIYVVITMRSDFIGDCAQFYGLPEALNQSQYLVPRLSRLQLKNSIEGPIGLFKAKIAPALISKLLNDAQVVKDELPLLQHALMRIWDYHHAMNENGQLTIEDYNAIGGIEKALSNHADEALQGMTNTELHLTKKIFQALTSVDENGRKIRRPAHLSELLAITGAERETVLSIVDRFIEGNKSFLIITPVEDKGDLLIDISHESLIRQWGTLNNWVEEEAEARRTLSWIQTEEWKNKMSASLAESAKLHEDNEIDYLSGLELQLALRWLDSFEPNAAWVSRYGSNYENTIQFIRESEKRWNVLQNEKAKQQARKVRNRRLLLAGLVFVILLISAFTYSIYKNSIRNKRELALNYWRSSQYVRTDNNYLDGLHLIAEAAVTSNDRELIKSLLIDGEACLPHTFLRNIFTQNDIINGVVFSASGNRILIAGNNGNARIIDKTTGQQIGHDMRHQSPVNSAVFSSDGKFVLTTGNDNTARIWDAATGEQIHSFDHDDDVTGAVFSPDGKYILTGSSDGYAQIWQIATGKKIDSFVHVAEVSSVAFNVDGTKILTTCSDTIPHMWNLQTKAEISLSNFSSHNKGSIVYYAAYNNNGKKILTIGDDSALHVYDSLGNELALLKHNARVTDAVFSPDGKWILTAGVDKLARLWDIETQSQTGAAMKHDGAIYSVAFSSDSKQIITAGFDKTIRLWDVEFIKGENAKIFNHNGIVSSAVFSPDETKILTASYDSTARLWDIEGKQLFTLKHSGRVNTAVFSPDGKKILTASNDSTAGIWDMATGKQTGSLKPGGKIISAVFSTNGELILTADYDNNINIWNATQLNSEPTRSFKFKFEISSAIFSADGKTILVSGGDSAAHIVDAGTGMDLISFKTDNIVNNAVFSANGNNVLTAGTDRTARIWDISTETQKGPAMKHNAEVNSAVFSSDGKYIITSAWDNAAHLWYASTLKEIGIQKKHSAPVTSAVFSSKGKWILTTGYDSTARLWEINGDLDLPVSLFKLQARVSTGVAYNIETSDTRCISSEKWLALKKEYDDQAKEHYKTCKYPQYNLWKRFNKDDAEKIRPKEPSSQIDLK